MAKGSDKLRGGVDLGETGGALSGLLAEEDEFDRRTLWRLGAWAAVSVGAVVLAFLTNQSSIGLRRDQTASIDLARQAHQSQLAARESQNETRRLASAIETLNSDRDRLYSKVAVLEQGLDSVTGAIGRQAPAPSQPPASSSATGASQASASAAPAANPSVTASSPASLAPATSAPAAGASAGPSVTAATIPVDPPPAAAKASPAPAVAPVAATAPAVLEKQDKQAAKPPPPPEPAATTVASLSAPPAAQTPAQPSGSLMASKSMMSPPDPAAGKLIEPASPIPSSPPKTVTSAPLPEITTLSARASEQAEPGPAPAAPELPVRRTEFGVDVGGANSVPGLRALWRGLLKSRSKAALTLLRPIMVIKENNNGLGMQLRLVAGPISDAAAAAKICASLSVNDRGCTTSVYEGQRLVMSADEQPKLDAKPVSEAKASSDKASSDKAAADKATSEAKPESDAKPTPKYSGHRYYLPKHSSRDEDPPKPEPSTFSRLFSTH
jgi:hypothetical protein